MAGKKRKALDGNQKEEPEPKKTRQDNQQTIPKNITIPIDETFTESRKAFEW